MYGDGDTHTVNVARFDMLRIHKFPCRYLYLLVLTAMTKEIYCVYKYIYTHRILYPYNCISMATQGIVGRWEEGLISKQHWLLLDCGECVCRTMRLVAQPSAERERVGGVCQGKKGKDRAKLPAV